MDRSGWMTSKSERAGYGLYFMGQNAIYTFQFLFLATFLLMNGLEPLATAGIMMAVKVWDAINDCLFGGIVDNVRFKKGLKFLPWLRLSLPLIALSLWLNTTTVKSHVKSVTQRFRENIEHWEGFYENRMVQGHSVLPDLAAQLRRWQ